MAFPFCRTACNLTFLLLVCCGFAITSQSLLVFSYQLLQDLKPGNLAINQDCELKVQLFTLITQINNENENVSFTVLQCQI